MRKAAADAWLDCDSKLILNKAAAAIRAAIAASPAAPAAPVVPIDMVLHCPKCGLQHIDAPDERTHGWRNEPHRSHLCHGCGHIWRPADVPTNGVAAVATKGKADSPIAAPVVLQLWCPETGELCGTCSKTGTCEASMIQAHGIGGGNG